MTLQDVIQRWLIGLAWTALCAAGLSGCTTEQARERALQVQALAQEADAEIDRLTVELEAIDTSTPEGNELAADLSARLAATESKRAAYVAALEQAVDEIQQAGDAWAIGEAIGATAAGLLGWGVAVPFIRAAGRWRKHFQNTVRAVEAGGGPSTPSVTKTAMPVETRKAVRTERIKLKQQE